MIDNWHIPHDVELPGKSCNLDPLQSFRGVMISLLVNARPEWNIEAYHLFLSEPRKMMKGYIDVENPVRTAKMKYRSLGKCLDIR